MRGREREQASLRVGRCSSLLGVLAGLEVVGHGPSASSLLRNCQTVFASWVMFPSPSVSASLPRFPLLATGVAGPEVAASHFQTWWLSLSPLLT